MGATASSTSSGTESETAEAETSPPEQRSVESLAGRSGEALALALPLIAREPGGLRQLVEMRAAVLARVGEHPELETLERGLRALLVQRFAPEHLDLRAIGPDAPDRLLDRLTRHEAVHPIRNRDDLLRRLHPADRRCFGLFHPALDDDPLVFVEVALATRIETSVQSIIDAATPARDVRADTAIFYSINNCQTGLKTIPFGADLLHRVLDALMTTTTATTFSTLSPIPGFARWLGNEPPTGDDDLLAACARYLLTAKRGEHPLDPVARFHLGNGASLHQLNPHGDTSERGRNRYLGVTANYLYEPGRLRANADAYRSGEIIASDAVRSLIPS